MPFSFSLRILSKLLIKSAKSLKNAFSHGSRAVNTLYQLPAISNLRYTLFLILNENLTPSYHYSARILRANFHRNSSNGAIFREKSRIFSTKSSRLFSARRTRRRAPAPVSDTILKELSNEPKLDIITFRGAENRIKNSAVRITAIYT